MKITKKELARKIKALEGFADYADNLLTQLNHALPEPIEIKHWRDEQSDYDELIEILDSKEPKLKQLDQSVFDGLDEEWQFAAVDEDGRAHRFTSTVEPHRSGEFVSNDLHCGFIFELIGTDYDSTNWQNSLIERDKVGLTGSGLCRAMLERGDKAVLCKAYDDEENDFYYDAITSCSDVYFDSCLTSWSYAVPINNQGEPLTAADVGL